MRFLVVLSFLLLCVSNTSVQAQGLFDLIEEGAGYIDEAFTGDKAKAAEAKRIEDQKKAQAQYEKEQAELAKIADEKEKERIAVHALDANGENQLMRAIRANDSTVSKDLIRRGANSTLRNVRGVTPLHEAVRVGNPTLVDLMLVNGANISQRDNSGKTPMDYAMLSPQKEVVNTLVLNSAPVEMQHVDRAIQLEQYDVLDVLLLNSDKAPLALYSALTRGKTDLFSDILEKHNVEIDNSVFDYAVDKRNYEIAEVVLNKGINLNQAVDYAIAKGANQILPTLLDAGGDSNKILGYATTKRNYDLAENAISLHNADPNPYVSTAIDKNDMKLLDILMNNGADANAGLSKAIDKSNVVMVKKLLENGAEPNTHFKKAAISGNKPVVQAMLDNGADASLGAQAAAEAGKLNIAKMLVEAGADANPILPIAVKAKDQNLVKACLDQNADPSLGIKDAVNLNQTNIAVMLLDAGADGSVKEYIIKACENDNEKLVEKLIETGADSNHGMAISINKNNTGIVTLLIDAGADASNPEFIQESVRVGNKIITEKLLSSGADANQGIATAVDKNHTEIVKLLLENGADGTGSDLVKSSVKHNSTDLTSLLFDAGADPSVAVKPAIEAGANNVVDQVAKLGQDVTKAEYLNTAVSRKHSSTVAVLLRNGSDPNVPTVTGTGYKMLHVACSNVDFSTVQMLLQHDADVMAVASSSGDTPLHVLVMQKGDGKESAEIAETLIAAGADVNAKNSKGELVFQVAKGMKVKKVLKKNGASKGK